MINAFNQRIHIWQSVLVVLFVSLLSFLEIEFAFLRDELVGTPFFLLITIVVLMGDAFSGLFAILISTVALLFVGQNGWHFLTSSIGRSIEFFVVSLVVYYFGWRTRSLTRNTASLEDTIRHLQQTSKRLRSQARVSKNDLKKLHMINDELQAIVGEIMEDKKLWAATTEEVVKEKEKYSPVLRNGRRKKA